jgi:hypothetical protein
MFGPDSVVFRAKVRLANSTDEALRITRQYARYAKTVEGFTP